MACIVATKIMAAQVAGMLLLVLVAYGQAYNDILEYCERETFEADCEKDEVILMTSAHYGRMRLGRCVQKEYGSLGCSTDVLPYLDSRCSGRRQCSFPITNIHGASSTPCPSELIAYLEASFKCIKVQSCKSSLCSSGGPITLAADERVGYIGSVTTAENGCGSQGCPWLLQPKPGQRFNLTFYNFLQPSDQQILTKQCQRFASVLDRSTMVSTDMTVCGLEPRVRQMVTSESASVEVHVFTPRVGGDDSAPHFLLRYEVVGCPDIMPPDGATVKRERDFLTVKCNNSQRSWHLTCSGTAWVGEVGVCKADGAGAWRAGSSQDGATTTPQGLFMVIGIGVALGVVLGFSFLGLVIVCMKRRRHNAYERPGHRLMTGPEMDSGYGGKLYGREGVPPHGYPPSEAYFTYQTRQTGSPPQLPVHAHGGTSPHKAVESGEGSIRARDHVYESPHFAPQDNNVDRESVVNAINNNNRMDMLS